MTKVLPANSTSIREAAAVLRGEAPPLRLEPGDLPPAARPPEGIDPFFNVNTPDDLEKARALWPHFASSPSSGGRTPERPR